MPKVARCRLVFTALAALFAAACSHPPAAPDAAWQDRSPHTVRFVAVAPDVRLEVLDWGGNGLPLVFLSGLQDVAHGFDDFAPQFTDQHRVLAITRRGYGASSQTSSGYDLATRVADLRAVLDSLGLARVVLVGHSIAGDELTAFGGGYPDRVAGLVYLDAAYDHSEIGELVRDYPPPPPMTAADSASPAAVQAYRLRTFGEHIPLAQLTAIGRYDSTGHLVGDVTPASIDGQVLAGCGHPDYRRLRAPVLAIDAVVDSAPQLFPLWASYDSAARAMGSRLTDRFRVWGAAQRDSLLAGVPAARLVVLHGANHYVFDSNRAEVVTAMRELLAGGGNGS